MPAPERGADAARGGAAPVPPGGPRGARREPLRGLTVLYDPGCRLCGHVAGWLAGQRKLIPVRLVPVGSDRARALFPDLDHDGATRREVTVVGDAGQVYIGQSAWVVVLWALADHRALAHSMSTPAGRRLARTAVLGVARYREAQGAGSHSADLPRHPQEVTGIPPRPLGAPLAPAGSTTASTWVCNGRDGWVMRSSHPAAGPRTGTAAPNSPTTPHDAPGCADGCPPPG